MINLSLQCFPLESKKMFRENDLVPPFPISMLSKLTKDYLGSSLYQWKGIKYLNSRHFRAEIMFSHFVFIHRIHIKCVISSSRNVEVQVGKV